MNLDTLLLRTRHALLWSVPLAALLAIVGAEVEFGARAAAPAAAAPAARTHAVIPELLPEYTMEGGVETRTDTVNRTLFNPTRRPAPTPAQETPKPKMPRGQFALTGTTVVEGKGTAFLREVAGGKSRRVQQGDTINGMTVAEVKPDRVRLTMGGETEELVLKVQANPKPTPGGLPSPTAVAAVPGGAPGSLGMPNLPGAQGGQTPEQAAMTLIQRRRAARAAAAAAAAAAQNGGGTMGVPTPSPVAPPAPGARRPDETAARAPRVIQPEQASSSWADVFRHYQERAAAAAGQ